MGTNSTPIAGIGRILLRAILPAVTIIIATFIIPLPAVCGATPSPVTESSQTYKDPACNFIVKDLENEIAETTASLKNCGAQSSSSPKAAAAKAKECEQYERKLQLTKENLLHVKEQCDKGLTPDYLPKVIEDPNAIPCAQCGADKSLLKEPPAKVLTGLPGTGNVMDLKGGDPNLRSVFGKSAAAPALAAAGVPPPEFIGAWCCNNQFVEAANITAFYAKCCNICGEHCGTTPPVDPPPVDPPPVVVPPVEPPPVVVPPTEPPPPVVQPPAKKPGFFAKIGNFFKAIGKWLWDNIIKPIGDFFAGIYHKFKGDTDTCGEKRFNPDIECCKSGLTYSDIIGNISDCPERYQKILPTANGCGSGVLGYAIPDNPTGGANTSFLTPCYMHDRDYGTCKKDGALTDEVYRTAADQTFLKRMYAVCDGKNVPITEKTSCRENAGIYHAMVQDGGSGAYQDAQSEYCKCCPGGAL